VIAVDTSVWVAALRQPAGATAATMRALLDADEVALPLPVRLELLAGLARKDRAAFRRALAGLPVLRPTDDTWRLIEGWVGPAADKGQRFGTTDLLIGALAHELGALVWSLDSDFHRMEELGIVHLYR
jgi:predicted nucleic acid-binding protein